MPTVRTNDVETYYERRGDGPPIVFVHGAVVDHAQWDPQVAALDADYTVVTYDVRGHGRTGSSERETYSIDLLAEDLDALITELSLDRPVICGLSMGGCIAQVYAADHADRVAGLVLADTFAPEPIDWRDRFQRFLLRASIPPARLLGYERIERALVWFQERVQGDGVSGDYELIEALRAEGPKMEPDEFAKVIRAVARFHETDVDLSAIRIPTLVLYGEHDATFVRRHAANFGRVISNARVREVPDAGHAANLDNPDGFSGALRAFLERVHASDSGSNSRETEEVP